MSSNRPQDSMRDLLSSHEPRRNSQIRARESHTFKSSVFGDPESHPRQSSPYKIPDSLQSLGIDGSDYYRKNSSNYEPNFVPKYGSSSAADRRLFEFHGNCYPPEKTNEPKTQLPPSAKERKVHNMNWNHLPQSPQAPKERKVEFSPERRREEMLSSDVLGGSPYKYEKRVPEKENVEKRKQNHLYSDLFGNDRPQERARVSTARESEEPKKLTGLNRNPPKNQDAPVFVDKPISASLMKARELSTTYQTYQAPKTEQPLLVNLQFLRVPSSFSQDMIRTLCPTLHFVGVTLDVNNITGACTGTGTASLRSFDIEKDVTTLRYSLMKHNIEVSKKEENLGLKNNYSGMSSVNWLDPKLERPKTAERGARECKMSNLESSKDLFGDVGRWGEGWKQNKQPSAVDKQFIAQAQWINTLNAKRLF